MVKSKYDLLFSSDKHFAEVSKSEIDCRHTHSLSLCELQSFIKSDRSTCLVNVVERNSSENCEISRLDVSETVWFKIAFNQYAYVAPVSEQIKLTCRKGNSIIVENNFIKGTGRITLSDGCSLVTNMGNLYAHSHLESKIVGASSWEAVTSNMSLASHTNVVPSEQLDTKEIHDLQELLYQSSNINVALEKQKHSSDWKGYIFNIIVVLMGILSVAAICIWKIKAGLKTLEIIKKILGVVKEICKFLK